MPITAASTIREIEGQFLDNVDYEAGEGSVTKAKLFAAACRALIGKRPSDSRHGSGGLSYAPSDLRAMLEAAVAYIKEPTSTSTATTSGTTFLDCSEPRG